MRRIFAPAPPALGGVRLITTTDAAMDTLEAISPAAPPGTAPALGGAAREEKPVAMTSVPPCELLDADVMVSESASGSLSFASTSISTAV